MTSFHNITCDLVYFKLSIVLWHFIIINFCIPRVKSVNEYSLLYFRVYVAFFKTGEITQSQTWMS